MQRRIMQSSFEEYNSWFAQEIISFFLSGYGVIFISLTGENGKKIFSMGES